MSDIGPTALDNIDLLTPEMRAALKDLIANIAQHSRKQAALVDMLVGAVKAVNQDLQQQKLRNHLLDGRLAAAEVRVADLARTVDALRRQGWVQ